MASFLMVFLAVRALYDTHTLMEHFQMMVYEAGKVKKDSRICFDAMSQVMRILELVRQQLARRLPFASPLIVDISLHPSLRSSYCRTF